jgi:hypothetical protein
MAALGAPTMIAQSGPKTAIKISNHNLWAQLHYSKNSFFGQSKHKNRKGFRTCAWRATLCVASQCFHTFPRFARPNRSAKFLKV